MKLNSLSILVRVQMLQFKYSLILLSSSKGKVIKDNSEHQVFVTKLLFLVHFATGILTKVKAMEYSRALL